MSGPINGAPMVGHLIRRQFPLHRCEDHEFRVGPVAMLISDMLGGQIEALGFIDRITEVNDDEGTARDVTDDFAIATARYCGLHDIREVSRAVYDFIETHAGPQYARGLRIEDRSFAA